MKKVTLFLFLTGTYLVGAQSFDFHYDHYSIIVKDVDKSADFYAHILNLKETPHPDLKKGFRWFIINGNSQIHLIQKVGSGFEKNKSVHLCLATSHLEAVMAHLKENKVPFWDWPGKQNAVTDRSDGVRQIYLQDPDGYWIEINTAKH